MNLQGGRTARRRLQHSMLRVQVGTIGGYYLYDSGPTSGIHHKVLFDLLRSLDLGPQPGAGTADPDNAGFPQILPEASQADALISCSSSLMLSKAKFVMQICISPVEKNLIETEFDANKLPRASAMDRFTVLPLR
jgi:hypothetical protein